MYTVSRLECKFATLCLFHAATLCPQSMPGTEAEPIIVAYVPFMPYQLIFLGDGGGFLQALAKLHASTKLF